MTGSAVIPPQLISLLAVVFLSLISLVTLLLAGCSRDERDVSGAELTVTRVSEALGGGDTEGYLQVDRPREFSFPADHGPHEGFRNEWWYLTANLEDAAGARLGIHLTLFRVALAPEFAGPPELRQSPWSTRHIWMGHSAVTDLANGQHISEERFAREARGLAGAVAPQFAPTSAVAPEPESASYPESASFLGSDSYYESSAYHEPTGHLEPTGNSKLTDNREPAGNSKLTDNLAPTGDSRSAQYAEPGTVWLEDWSISGLGGEVWRVEFTSGPYRLDLELQPLRAPVLQGAAGWSQKGDEPEQASYYYSVPRILVTGTIYLTDPENALQARTLQSRTLHERTAQERKVQGRAVQGLAWLDREWSTAALDPSQIGWNWFALQLDDGTDVMIYELRTVDGPPHPQSKGRWMPADAPDQLLTQRDFSLQPLRLAQMPSGRIYPVEWQVRIPEQGVDWRVHAVFDDQEMNSFIPYWEGAVDIRDTSGQRIGRGFVELTGYESE